MIPDEVPHRQVEHQGTGEGYDPAQPEWQVGAIGDGSWYGTDDEFAEWEADLERRTRARARLGGFGFGRAEP